MNIVDEASAVAEHCDELSFTCSMLGALDARGDLSPTLKVRLAEAEALVAEGDQLDDARRKLRRARVGAKAIAIPRVPQSSPGANSGPRRLRPE